MLFLYLVRPLRSSKIKRHINGGFFDKMFTQRKLEKACVIYHKVDPAIPSKIEYTLTELGKL